MKYQNFYFCFINFILLGKLTAKQKKNDYVFRHKIRSFISFCIYVSLYIIFLLTILSSLSTMIPFIFHSTISPVSGKEISYDLNLARVYI